MSSSRRALAWGSLAVGAYVVAFMVTSSVVAVPPRPLYDGEVPLPPYNWVDPPSDLADDNEPPQPGSSTLEFSPEGSRGRTVATGDGQAFLILPLGAIEPREGEESVTVTIQPRRPSTTEFDGKRIDGNAYEYRAVYASGAPARFIEASTVVLRYPVHATEVVRQTATGWERAAETQTAPQSAQIFARVTELGTFAAAGEPPPMQIPRWAFIAAGSALAVVLALIVERRSAAKRRTGRRKGEVRRGAGRAGKRRR